MRVYRADFRIGFRSILYVLWLFIPYVTTARAQVVTQPVKSTVGLQINIPVIQSFPPIRPWMPYIVRLGYHYFDSLCNSSSREATDSITSTFTRGDSLVTPLKYLYQMDDYDPVTFSEWLRLTPSLSHYRTAPGYVYIDLLRQVSTMIPDTQRTAMLWGSDYIARVKITDVQNFNDSAAPEFHDEVLVSCQVLDTIKGAVLPPNPQTFTSPTEDAHATSAQNVLRFYYSPSWPRKATADDTLSRWEPRLRDGFGNPWITVGQEYIFFLSILFLGNDSTTFVMTVEPARFKSSVSGLYPIQNGIVVDNENDFGFGANLLVPNFIAAIRNRIAQLTHF